MRIRTLITVFVCALTVPLFARPALPTVKTVLNSDGSAVSIRHFGDEHYHYTETADGFLVTGDGKGNYVYVDERGYATEIVAKDAANRSAAEKSFLESLNQETAHQNFETLNGERYVEPEKESSFLHIPVMAYNQNGIPAVCNRPEPSRLSVGERYFPVLLVITTDKPLPDSAAFDAFLNQEGYDKNGNIGSLRDYFIYCSKGLFNPHFDVYPVDLRVALTTFGYGSDYDEGKLVADGIDALTKRADFKANADKYCTKENYVDGFFYLFPGMEEDALKQSELFWGHKYSIAYFGETWRLGRDAYESNGYKFSDYAFIAQFEDGTKHSRINQMGVFVHEFSHVLGLQDAYVKVNGVQYGPEEYDVMSRGMYNGVSGYRGSVPASYSAFEREAVGWLEMTEVEPDKEYSLKKLSESEAYSVTNPNWNDEYYIVEYRPAEKYDMKLPKKGVLVWYIDFDETLYYVNNAINKDPNHQRVAMLKSLSEGGYHVDFSFVNKSGVAAIPGIYNVVLNGNSLACFTTGKDMPAPECIEESSSSAESSESQSSGSVVSSSSGATSSSSNDLQYMVGRHVNLPAVHVRLEGRVLNVDAETSRLVSVSLFDVQGHLVLQKSLPDAANSVAVDLTRAPRGNYVVLVRVAGQSVKKIVSLN